MDPTKGDKDTVAKPNSNLDSRPQLENPPPESLQDCDTSENVFESASSKSDSNIGSQVEVPGPLEDPDIQLARSMSLESDQPKDTKKIVRFADSVGLDLAEVKRYRKGNAPKIPSSAYADLNLTPVKEKPPPVPSTSTQTDLEETTLVFVPQFQQPGEDSYFMTKLLEQKVCLESVDVCDASVTGYIRTLNVGFEKLVLVRYTSDKWASYEDIKADYLPTGSDDLSDKFMFKINLPSPLLNNKLIFSIRYVVNNEEFWDNNYSNDFVIKCVAQRV